MNKLIGSWFFFIRTGILLFGLSSASYAFTLDAQSKVASTNGTPTDVQNAINAVSDGWTVLIPNNNYTWTSGVTVSGKGIHIKGEQKGAVTITHNAGTTPLFTLSGDDNLPVRMSNLRFVEGSGGKDAWNGMYVYGVGSGHAMLIHDNIFETTNWGRRAISWTNTKGVIYKNEFLAHRGDGQAIQIVNNGYVESWSTPDTMGAKDIKGESNVYIEDNIFREYPNQSLDPDGNSRVVIRHNLFDNAGMASHGADTSQFGTRHWEIYNNTFTFTNFGDCDGSQTLGISRFMFIRGGTGIIADNVIPDLKSCA